MTDYRPRSTVRDKVIATVVAAVVVFTVVALCRGQAPQKPKAYLLSPAWFDCKPCKDATAELKAMGCEVTVIKLSREQTTALSVKGFPTVLVGEAAIVGNEPGDFRRALR
jgi:hypothetical protein